MSYFDKANYFEVLFLSSLDLQMLERQLKLSFKQIRLCESFQLY